MYKFEVALLKPFSFFETEFFFYSFLIIQFDKKDDMALLLSHENALEKEQTVA